MAFLKGLLGGKSEMVEVAVDKVADIAKDKVREALGGGGDDEKKEEEKGGIGGFLSSFGGDDKKEEEKGGIGGFLSSFGGDDKKEEEEKEKGGIGGFLSFGDDNKKDEEKKGGFAGLFTDNQEASSGGASEQGSGDGGAKSLSELSLTDTLGDIAGELSGE